MFKQGNVIYCFDLCITNQVNESFYRFRCVTSPSPATECWHSRIVPSSYTTLLNQFQQFPLAHHGIGKIETVELDLPWPVIISFQLIDKPIVQWTVNFKFEGAKRMSNPFKIITLSVSKVVHGIYHPGTAGPVMG